jgi:hypothetical protein
MSLLRAVVSGFGPRSGTVERRLELGGPAKKGNDRLFSAYGLGRHRFWIVTEADGFIDHRASG